MTSAAHPDVERRVREILDRDTSIPDALRIGRDENLRTAGMSSLEMVTVILSIEDEWSIRFDESALSRSVLESVATLCAAVGDHLDAA